ncbi:MAG: hypothetical protein IJ169_06535 [Paludibacteraceae bacterium]|nr:hypothetical protein [Paludibacteraceae bacterium]
MMLSETASWKWLADYLIGVCNANGWDLTTATEAQWRWTLDSFFNKRDKTTWPMASTPALFTEAGKEEQYLPAYEKVAMFHKKSTLPRQGNVPF